MKWRFWLRQNPSLSDDCASIEPLLSLYSDGMASAGETRRVESHLSACEDCRRALGWMQATRLVISERPAALPPIDLRARIARAIAEAEPTPLTIRTARRPAALRPALYALAASLMVAGVVIEHSLHVAKHPVVPPLTTVAQTSPSILRSTSPFVSRPPSASSRVAAIPPHRLSPVLVNRLPAAKHPAETKMALVPNVPPRETPVLAAPVTRHDHAKPHIAPVVKSNLMAMLPKTTPHTNSIKPPTADKTTAEAMDLPKKPLHDQHDDVLSPDPELATPPAPIETAAPKPTQVAIVAPVAPPSAHEDVLSNVRARLATYRTENSPLKVYRDGNVHAQTAAFDSETKFVQAPINWTPTHIAAK